MFRFIRKSKLLALAASSLISLPAFAAESSLKVAYVDTNEILGNYTKAQDAIKKLNDAETKLRSKIQSKRESLRDIENDKSKTETEKQMLFEKFRQEIEPEAKKLEQEAQKRSKEVEQALNESIKSVAKRRKVDLVLAKPAVLYGGSDMSAEVTKELQKRK